ncbi:MAG: Hsp70 family protein [Deltaproteobacteria bacterium]|nr:Hsp70 family protein [Deltaproteobacteria bacterium]
MAKTTIGIDLGTSNSCVAIAGDGEPRVLNNARDEAITPSVVYFKEDGSIDVGLQAKVNVIHDPANTVYSAKRLIGRYFFSDEVKKAKAVYSYGIEEGPDHSIRIKIRDEVLSLAEISAMVLREMKQVAEGHVGDDIEGAVITVPAFFNDNQRQATRDAGQIAGLNILRILNEPTAAALAYGFGKELDQRVAVYDLGGGTFDISILEINNDVFEVLATAGDTYLGGDDFDDRIIDFLADRFVAEHKINLRNDPHAYERLKLQSEAIKKEFSKSEEVAYSIMDLAKDEEGNALSIEGTISLQEFTTLVMDLIQRTFKVCDEAMQQASLTNRDLDGIILVGGPTRLPLVRNSVKEYFQQEPKADIDPDKVVAVGAAIHAAALTSDNQDTHLLDVTPLTLRIGVAGGLAETIIEANTPIPIEQTRAFTTFQDYQETVKLRVYQGESRHAEENEMLGEFAFSGFETGRRGEVRIDVIFSINTDGIVEVTAMDPATGVKASTELTLSSGLSQEEIKEIMEVGRANDVVTETTIGTVNLVKMPRPQLVEADTLADDLDLDDLSGDLDLAANDLDDALSNDLGLDTSEELALDGGDKLNLGASDDLDAGDQGVGEAPGGVVLDDFAPDPAMEALIDENALDFDGDPDEGMKLDLDTGDSSNQADPSMLTGDENELELETDEDELELELDEKEPSQAEMQESRDLLFGDGDEDLSLTGDDEEKPE